MVITADQAEEGRAIRSMVFTAGFWPRLAHEGSDQPYRGEPFSERGSEKSRFVFAEGVNYINNEPVFNNPWKLAGNRVWYQFADSNIRDKHEHIQEYFKLDNKWMNEHDYTNVRKFLDSDDPAMARMGLAMGQGYDDLPMEGQQMAQHFVEKEFFGHMFNAFTRNNARYTGRYLSALMAQLRQDLRTSGATHPEGVPASGHLAKGQARGRYSGYTQTLSKTAGALMREEQTRVVEGGKNADKSGLVGLTQPVDTTYITMMGRVHIDVSERTLTEGGHHGLSAGPIMSQQEAQDLAGGEHFDEIKERVFDYYQARIPEWNEGIIAIREKALEQTGGKTVGPGAMRRAGFGAGDKIQRSKPNASTSRHPKFGSTKSSPALRYGKGGYATKQKILRNASVSGRTVANNLFNSLGVENLNTTASSFILHGIGTWSQHKGKYYHALTVSKDPHVSTSIFFRMYGRYARRAYEYKDLREDQDVQVHHGFASLAILEQLGHLASENYVQSVQDMSDTHLGARYIQNTSEIVRNTVMAQGARTKGIKMTQKMTSKAFPGEKFEMNTRGGIGSTAIYIPSGWSANAISRTMEIFEGKFNSTGANRANFRTIGKRAARPFQESMEALEENSTNWNAGAFWPKIADFWASPYYGVGYEPPLEE